MASKGSKKAQQGTTPAPLFVLEYGARRILVAPPTDYNQLQKGIRRHFPDIPSMHRVSYYTKDLDVCEGSLVEVSPDIWDTVIPMLKKLTVQTVLDPSARKNKAREEQEDSECTSCDEG